jgi:hypothetical protein
MRPTGLLLLCILLDATIVNAQTEVTNKANSSLFVVTADGAPIEAKVPVSIPPRAQMYSTD